MQPRLHPEKKTVPAPRSPDMQGSSQLWSIIFATEKASGELQNPFFSPDLSASHFLGHILQLYTVTPPLFASTVLLYNQRGVFSTKSARLGEIFC
jgi:hypothetical protein